MSLARTMSVLAFTASLLLGGCVDVLQTPDASLPPLLLLDGSRPCEPSFVANCDEVQADPAAPYRLRAISMDIHESRNRIMSETGGISELLQAGSTALRITKTDRDVIIDSFKVHGFGTGISVEHVDCPICTITIRNALITEDNEYINATGMIPSMVATARGIHVNSSHVNIRIEDSTIYLRAYDGEQPNEGWWFPASVGIAAREFTGTIQIEGVRIGAPGQTLGSGIVLDLDGAAALNDVVVRNHDSCILVHGGTLRVESAQLRECTRGLAVGIQMDDRPFKGMHLQDFLIEDMTTYGIIPTPPAPLCPDSDQLLRESVFDQILTTITIRDGTVARSGTAALGTTFPLSIELNRVAFLGNGHEPHGPGFATGGIVNPCGWITMRDSIFEGNVGTGYWGQPSDDIRWNWWGDPTGPRLQPVQGAPGIGEGDAVGGLALNYSPFLTERPE